jgi:glycosyltransferase involved in cell wall biosynthesis
MIPWPVREGVRSILALPEAIATGMRRSGIRKSTGREIRVGFGGVLEDGRPVHGGAVKLLPLREAFGGDETAFHILYAVSSSQPQFPESLFRHCRARGIRIVWNQNGVGYPAWAGAESERFNRPMRVLRGMADFVVYQSEFCRRSAARFIGASDIASAVLLNPVDPEFFSPATVERKPGALRLLAAGTHGTRDRVVGVLDALGRLREGGVEAELTVAGGFQWRDGEADFAREAGRLGLVEFVRRVGRFSQDEARDLYRSHDLLIHPKYMDPCPTVVIEALACGLPVVGSNSGGMPEIVPAACGRLIEAPEDWDVRHTPGGQEIAGAVAELVPRLPEAASAARQHAVEAFGVDRWMDAHRRIFSGLVG